MDEETSEVKAPDVDDTSTLELVRRHKKEADEAQSQWREEARECYAFVAGDQWDAADKSRLIDELRRTPVTFNRIAPMVDAVAGSEVNNRQAVKYIPRQPGDTGVNDVLTGAADYIRDNCDAEDEESDAFLDAVICGIGVTETRLDYEDDPEGTILVERRDSLSMRWDPAAKKRNLADRTWHQYDAWLSKDEILAKWPNAEIAATDGWGSDRPDDQEPHDQTIAWLYERDSTGYDSRTGKYRVIHDQWFELESYHLVLDTTSGQPQIVEFTGAEFDKLTERLQTLGMPAPRSIRKQRKVYKQAFVCGSEVLEEGPAPCNRFGFHFITAKRDRNKGTWYGIVRAMMDPQRWANKFFSQILHIINTNAKGGLMMESDAVEDVRKFKREWAKSDAITMVEPGAISGGKIQPKAPPVIPPQINDMLSFSISSLRDVTGINLELLGMADRQQAGILEAQRKQAAMTVLATLFDGLRRYRKEQGRTLACFIRDYMSDGRLVRVVGGDGTERYIPLIRDALTLDVDVIVDEAPNTINRKEQTFAILMQLLPHLAKVGVPFGPDLLEYTPLPASMVDKWKQQLQQQQAQAAQQPPQPDPRMVMAQADMVRAQAAAGKAQADAQQAQAELPVKQQELQVRALEAQVAQLQAMVEGLVARFQLGTLSGGVPQVGPGMPNMPTPSMQ